MSDAQPTSNLVAARLDVLLGAWEMQASIGGQLTGRGRTTFEPLEAGAYIIQRSDAEPPLPGTPPEWVANSPFPLTAIFGLDDFTQTFSMLYADARGVCRVYQMSLDGNDWNIWGRPGPTFFQRFTGTFGDQGTTINAGWESSRDGSTWEPDFDLTYTKVS
jgi:hypothetical protein